MSKFWHLVSKLSKTSAKFEISTFEIEFTQSFVKIRKLLFGPKGPNLRIWAHNFQKQMSDLKPAPSK